MTSRHEQPRIIDKRQTISGTEYLVSTTGEWVPSSASRFNNPELVELFEWLRSSGFREGATVFASLQRSKFVTAKGARKRVQSGSSVTAAVDSTPVPASSGRHETSVTTDAAIVASITTTTATIPASFDDIREPALDPDTSIDADRIETSSLDSNSDHEDLSMHPMQKKPRLDSPYIDELSHLSIDVKSELGSSSLDPSQTETPTPTRTPTPTPTPTTETFSVKKEPAATPPGEQAQVLQFNRNSEQLIEGYFKEGMDATGVEMFDILLGPHRRPKKEFIASFFYAVILSPLTEPATIEAAIHVLDRTLTIHGPEPFQNIWDVQKRRREIADGTNAFSRLSSSSSSGSIITAGSGSGMSTRSSVGGGSEASLSASNVTGASSIPLPKGRLPSWNTMWDLIRAEFGLDTRPESKHHIALQEYHIRMRLQGEDLIPEPSTMGKAGQGNEDLFQEDEEAQGVREEQEVRDEIGRAIVGLLLRILEQDAVLKNVSSMSYFCHNVLMTDPYSPMHTVRPALDTAFQIISLATSSRYLEPPPPPKTGRDSTAVRVTRESKATRPSPSWPLQEHYTLNAAGMEILQLGQQFLLLLIRFTEAGQLLPGKGMEELAREALSRLSKVNRDRKAPVASGSSRSGASTGAGAGLGTPFFLERCNLDQTEIFLKTLIQGPCLLDAGTGSGSGVKLRRENSDQQKENTGGSGQEYSISADDYNGILKSQTGICVGSSAFVMTLVDLWFRSKTTAGGSTQMSFRRVVEEYARPGTLRPSSVTAATTAVTGPKNEKLRVSKRRRTTKGRKASQPPSDEDNNDDEVLESREIPSSETDRGAAAEQWNAKDLEQLEWVVMMIEVLVWSWIEARGIRRDEIAGTGLERALFPEEASQDHAESNTSSGWLEMSRLLMTIGGTLQTRWEQLESIIEAAILVEDLCLR